MTKRSWVAIQMKAVEQYFRVVLFTELYKVVITFKFDIKNFCVYPLQRKRIITQHSTIFKHESTNFYSRSLSKNRANFPYKNKY